MREIKFRAWNLGEMHHFGLQDISANGAVVGCEHGCFDLTGKDGHVEIMQYTGLKDKNGVEIYEGDIVRAKGKEGTFNVTVNWEQDNCSAGWSLSSIGWYKEELKVIGNIYENPELVK